MFQHFKKLFPAIEINTPEEIPVYSLLLGARDSGCFAIID
jgi:hypothetical protein